MFALIAAVTMMVGGCVGRGQVPETEPYLRTAYWQAFPLPLGGSAVFPDSLVVTFAEVPEDSRCPRGVECVHAGSATVLLTVWTPRGDVDSLYLATNPSTPPHGLAFGHDIELRRVLPEPVADVEIAPSEYTAIVVVGKY